MTRPETKPEARPGHYYEFHVTGGKHATHGEYAASFNEDTCKFNVDWLNTFQQDELLWHQFQPEGDAWTEVMEFITENLKKDHTFTFDLRYVRSIKTELVTSAVVLGKEEQ